MTSNILLYTTETSNVSVQVQYEDGTFWLTQKRMAELFGVEVHAINYHLKAIFIKVLNCSYIKLSCKRTFQFFPIFARLERIV